MGRPLRFTRRKGTANSSKPKSSKTTIFGPIASKEPSTTCASTGSTSSSTATIPVASPSTESSAESSESSVRYRMLFLLLYVSMLLFSVSSGPWHRSESLDCVILSRISTRLTIDGQAENGPPSLITHSVQLRSGRATVFVRGFPLKEEVTVESEKDLISTLDSLHMCPGKYFLWQYVDNLHFSHGTGNPDERYFRIRHVRKEDFVGKKGTDVAMIDRHSPFSFKEVTYKKTIRSADCSLLVAKERRCNICQQYRQTLNKQYNRAIRNRPAVASACPNSSLDTPMRVKKLVELAAKRKTSKQRIQRLQSAITSSVASHGVCAEEELHSELVNIVDDNTASVEQEFPPGSFQ